MRSIIGEFYLGNITPDVTVIKKPSELQKAVREMADAESFLREHLDGESLRSIHANLVNVIRDISQVAGQVDASAERVSSGA